MNFTREECHAMLDLLKLETVVEPGDGFPYRIVKPGFGYSKNPLISTIQMKLSVRLEVIGKMEEVDMTAAETANKALEL